MCSRECQHPLWGGGGICIKETQNSPAVCSCDAGFVSQDALGNASCVPERVLVTGYDVVAITSVLTTALLVWDMNRYRYLPSRCRGSKKTITRMRTLFFLTIYVIGFIGIGLSLALKRGDAGYLDSGAIQVLYLLLSPSLMFAVSMIAESWVNNLPSQLITPESFAGKLKTAADEKNLFVVMGILNAGTIACFGVLAFIDPILAILLADITVIAGGAGAMPVILFVSVRTTGVINQAISKGPVSATSSAFYAKAKKNLWVQAAGLCGAGVAFIVVIAIKYLTLAGRTTPVIIFNMQIMTGHLACIFFSLVTRFDTKPKAQSGNVTNNVSVSGVRKAGICRVMGAISDGGAAALALMPSKPSSWVRQGEELIQDYVGEASYDDSENQVLSMKTKITLSEGGLPKKNNSNTNSVLPTEQG